MTGIGVMLVPLCMLVAAARAGRGAYGYHEEPPPPAATPSVALRGYRRFHANDSLIGQPLPCTHEEKLCFQFNLFHRPGNSKCTDYDTIGDREEFWHGTGHLRAIASSSPDPCFQDGNYRMAYDSNCYKGSLVRDIICGCDAEPTSHFLGGAECRCSSRARVHVEQPPEAGRCRIPDLRFPDYKRSRLYEGPFQDIQGFKITPEYAIVSDPPRRFSCSRQQFECFSEHKLWVPEAQGCFRLLERGPCAEEHVVLLDVQAALEGRMEATCKHVRLGCPEGHVRAAFDGECHSEKDLTLIFPAGSRTNQFGMTVATKCDAPNFIFEPDVIDETMPETCIMKVTFLYAGCGGLAYIPCYSKDGCKRYEVLTEPPRPE